MHVYPKPGLVVRGPDKRLLPAAGLDVSDTDFFWNRRMRDGDVTTTPPLAAPPAAAPAQTSAIAPPSAEAAAGAVPTSKLEDATTASAVKASPDRSSDK